MQQSPEGFVVPTNGQIGVALTNNTGSTIRYQAVGYTEDRLLGEGATVELQNLPIPLTVRFYRPSGAMLTAYLSREVETENQVNLVIEETNSLDDDLDAMRIEDDGLIFLM